MKKTSLIIFSLLILALLFGCATSTKTAVGEKNTGEERPAPVSIYVNKGNPEQPAEIQVTNLTKRLLNRLEAILTFEDSTSGLKCEIEVLVIGEKWKTIGDSRRAFLVGNSTDMFNIDAFEFKSAECWTQILELWPEVTLHGKIIEIEFAEE